MPRGLTIFCDVAMMSRALCCVKAGTFGVASTGAALEMPGIPAMQAIAPSSHVNRVAGSPPDDAASLLRTRASRICAGWAGELLIDPLSPTRGPGEG